MSYEDADPELREILDYYADNCRLLEVFGGYPSDLDIDGDKLWVASTIDGGNEPVLRCYSIERCRKALRNAKREAVEAEAVGEKFDDDELEDIVFWDSFEEWMVALAEEEQ